MGAFTSKTDIGNRALQHCGADRMGNLGFDEPSKRASEISFVYDKLRQAELQRNTWTFATRRTTLRAIDTTTMALAPTLWGSTTTYFRGHIVLDANQNLWISNIPNNTGNDPLLTSAWDPYFGPLTASLYDSTLAYASGEIIYTFPGDGTYRVYLSLLDGNSDNPATATAWVATTTYFKNQVVTRLSVTYMSLIDLNMNQDPASAPAIWNSGTTYSAGTHVGGSDGVIYSSIGSGNVGHDPVSDLTHTYWTNTGVLNPWTTVFTGGSGSVNWLEIGGAEFSSGVALATLNIVYPLGAGPSSQSFNQNVFRLPAGFLRLAPQNPKVPVPMLGAPTGNTYNDWNIENGYIVSAETGPIRLRFIADVTDVRIMDTMFCEGLGARIGIEVCQPITQSDARLQTIAGLYKKFMDEARTINAIEFSYDDPPDDVFISVRA